MSSTFSLFSSPFTRTIVRFLLLSSARSSKSSDVIPGLSSLSSFSFPGSCIQQTPSFPQLSVAASSHHLSLNWTYLLSGAEGLDDVGDLLLLHACDGGHPALARAL